MTSDGQMVTRVVAVGDIMLGRDVGPSLRVRGEDILGPDVRAVLRSGVATGNLECVLTRGADPNPYAHSALRADVDLCAEILRLFTVVSLANNHINDFGDEGIIDTMEALSQLGVAHVGVGGSDAEATTPVVVELGGGGGALAWFGATTVPNVHPRKSSLRIATPTKRLLEAIRQARSDGCAVLVHLHAARGDTFHPAWDVVVLHRSCIEAGASATFGHHSHRVQGWRAGDGTASFFGLGDFIFDRLNDDRSTGLVATVDLLGGAVSPPVIHFVSRGPDLTVSLAGPETDYAVPARLAEVNSALEAGTFDARYRAELAAGNMSLMEQLRQMLRAGGARGLIDRLRHKGLRPIAGRLLTAARSRRP
jgi:hypothetical protein